MASASRSLTGKSPRVYPSAAAAGGFLIWWSATNFLSAWGVHYLMASLLATGVSVAWSMFTNFLWIWRHQPIPEGVIAGTERQASGSH
jgi:hypothetical protein